MAIAKSAEETFKIVLVDRSYVSTLAYNYVRYKQELDNHYKITLEWYMNGKQKGILPSPDLFVFLKVPPDISTRRAKENNRYFDSENPSIGEEFYEIFFDTFEPDVPLLILDGTLSHDKLIKSLLNYINGYHRKRN